MSSSPDPDLETQTKRHKGPLGGIALGLVFVAVLLVAFIIWSADEPGQATDEPDAVPLVE